MRLEDGAQCEASPTPRAMAPPQALDAARLLVTHPRGHRREVEDELVDGRLVRVRVRVRVTVRVEVRVMVIR